MNLRACNSVFLKGITKCSKWKKQEISGNNSSKLTLEPTLPSDCHQMVFALCNWADSLRVCVSVRPIGGRLSRGDGEGLSSADLPPQPPLSVEETGPAQEETPGLVSDSVCVCVCACVTIVQCVTLFLLTSQCVTSVSSSAATLDAMEKSSLFSRPFVHMVEHIISSFCATFSVSLCLFVSPWLSNNHHPLPSLLPKLNFYSYYFVRLSKSITKLNGAWWVCVIFLHFALQQFALSPLSSLHPHYVCRNLILKACS